MWFGAVVKDNFIRLHFILSHLILTYLISSHVILSYFITGELDSCGQERFGEELGFDKFGAIMTFHGANENSTLGFKIKDVEFTNVGQAYRAGRYPVNIYMTGDSTGSYVNKSSFHNSFNRAMALNGANNIEIIENVAFNIDGSAFYIGDATGNTFDGNVAVNVKSISGGLNTDFTAACFLISNPNNDIINNVAVGCGSHGYWFNLPIHPTGPSLDDTICPQNTPLGNFSRNTAHSNGRYGIFTFETFTPQMDGNIPPLNGICKQKTQKAISATFSGITAWNNFVGVGFVNGSGLRCDYCILVQNSHANFRGVTSVLGPKIPYSWPARKKRGVVAAYSLGDVFYGLSNSVIVGRTYSDALWQPNQGVNGVTEIGAAIPFGYSVGIENTAFINYNVPSTYPLQLTKIRENYLTYSGYPFWVLGLTFENVYQKGIFRRMYEAVVHDVDNSIECSPGDSGPSKVPSKILPYLPILSPDSYETCTWFDNSLIEAIIVPYSMQFHQFSFDVIHPSYFENKAGFSRDNRSMTATFSRRREGTLGRGFSVTLPDCGDGGGPIRWHFEDAEHIQNISVKIVISDVQVSINTNWSMCVTRPLI